LRGDTIVALYHDPFVQQTVQGQAALGKCRAAINAEHCRRNKRLFHRYSPVVKFIDLAYKQTLASKRAGRAMRFFR